MLRAMALNCTLKGGSDSTPSSTDRLLTCILEALKPHSVEGQVVRVADLNIKPGVRSDEGPGDEWPNLRRRILESNILILGTPIWLGQPSSICKRVLERMDAFLGETDAEGRMPSYGRIATVAVVGNEDGAHHVTAELYQALNDVGFTIPAGGGAYWVGEAMGKVNFVDLPDVPVKVRQTVAALTRNAAHLAELLDRQPYPPSGG